MVQLKGKSKLTLRKRASFYEPCAAMRSEMSIRCTDRHSTDAGESVVQAADIAQSATPIKPKGM